MKSITTAGMAPPPSGPPEITPERVARWNRSAHERADKAAPLLSAAGVLALPELTVELAQARRTATDTSRQLWATHVQRKARLMRFFVGRRVGTVRLAELDARWSTGPWPKRHEYLAEYWCSHLAQLIGREKPGVNPVVWQRRLARAYRVTFGLRRTR